MGGSELDEATLAGGSPRVRSGWMIGVAHRIPIISGGIALVVVGALDSEIVEVEALLTHKQRRRSTVADVRDAERRAVADSPNGAGALFVVIGRVIAQRMGHLVG